VNLAGIILAAGHSRRMGSPKALLTFEGETFADRLARLFCEHCTDVIVVTGAHAISVAPPARTVFNPDFELGQLTSLQCGLRAAGQVDGVMFTPVDCPGVRPETVSAVVNAYRERQAPITAPAYHGYHGHPVCVSPLLIRELLSLPPGAQARDVIRAHREQAVYLDVDDPLVIYDVDDSAAYEGLRQVAR
jgi:CTP:molybdopterin cytidylyltransferase MocA